MQVHNRLYDGKVKLIFNDFKHQYKVEGENIPSVTKILSVIAKPQLIPWAARMSVEHIQKEIIAGKSYDELQLNTVFEDAKSAHWKKKKTAGDIGTLVHNWIEDYINNKNPPMPINEQLSDAINNFLGWVKKYKVEFKTSEQPIYSIKHKYAGIIDFICTIDNKLYIGDIKTSKGIYVSSYGSQVMAYMGARKEEFPKEKYEGFVVIRVGKDGSFEKWVEKDNTEIFYKNFLNILNANDTEETIKRMQKDNCFRFS